MSTPPTLPTAPVRSPAWHALETAAVAESLGTDVRAGLTPEEAVAAAAQAGRGKSRRGSFSVGRFRVAWDLLFPGDEC